MARDHIFDYQFQFMICMIKLVVVSVRKEIRGYKAGERWEDVKRWIGSERKVRRSVPLDGEQVSRTSICSSTLEANLDKKINIQPYKIININKN